MLGEIKVSKGAKIRNRYNQVPHLTYLKPYMENSTKWQLHADKTQIYKMHMDMGKV